MKTETRIFSVGQNTSKNDILIAVIFTYKKMQLIKKRQPSQLIYCRQLISSSLNTRWGVLHCKTGKI